MRFAKLVLVSLTLIASSCAGFADRHWEKSTSQGLVVIADGAKSIEAMNVLHEAIAALGELGFSVTNKRPIVIVFTTDSDKVSQAWPNGAEIAGLGGITTGFEDKIYVLVNRSKRNSSYALRHELVHALLREKYLQIPLWLDEGLADNLSSYRISGAQVGLGQIDARHRWRQGSCSVKMSLPDVLESDYRNADYAHAGGAVLHISDLAVRYLIDKYGLEKIFRFLEATESVSQTEALRTVFSQSPKQLNDEAIHYCKDGFRSMRFTHQVVTPIAHTSSAIPADYVHWLDLEMRSRIPGHTDEVLEHYKKYLASDPNDVAAHRGLGIALVYQEKYSEALTHFARLGHAFDDDSTTLYLRSYACQHDPSCDNDYLAKVSKLLATPRPDLSQGLFDLIAADSENDDGLLPNVASDSAKDSAATIAPHLEDANSGNSPESVTLHLVNRIRGYYEGEQSRKPGFDQIDKNWNCTLNGKRVSRESRAGGMRTNVMQGFLLDEFEATPVGKFPARFVVTYRLQTTSHNQKDKKTKIFSAFVKETYDYVNSQWKETKVEAVTAK
jgi:tetratricopeptide (TPR) repeat protein